MDLEECAKADGRWDIRQLRLSMDESDFNKRTVDLEDGLDPMIPVTHPHVGKLTR